MTLLPITAAAQNWIVDEAASRIGFRFTQMGSPVKGQFDHFGSDIRFDPAKCRNISVDIRYVLFIIDKLCGAGHLVDEMQLVHDTSDGPRLIPLPIHR